MPRYTYVAILAVAVFVFWAWQDENIREGPLAHDDTATDQPEAETRRALTPAEKSAYADAIKTAPVTDDDLMIALAMREAQEG